MYIYTYKYVYEYIQRHVLKCMTPHDHSHMHTLLHTYMNLIVCGMLHVILKSHHERYKLGKSALHLQLQLIEHDRL